MPLNFRYTAEEIGIVLIRPGQDVGSRSEFTERVCKVRDEMAVENLIFVGEDCPAGAEATGKL